MYTQSSHDPRGHPPPKLFKTAQKSAWLLHLLAQTKTLQTLQQLFDQECPLEVMGRGVVLGIKERCLMVGTDHASSAMQLQYRTRELLTALKKYDAFRNLKKISVRVMRDAVPTQLTEQTKPRPALLVPETVQMFQQMAQAVSDSALKAALLRFVQNSA
jgi:hypothetical protein